MKFLHEDKHDYFKILDVPKLPNDLQQELQVAIDNAKENDQDLGWVGKDKTFDTRTVTRDGKTMRSCRVHHNPLPKSIDKWLKENVLSEYLYSSLAVTHPVSDTHGMHCGRTRRYLIMYLVETGGDNVITRGFEEEGYPRERINELDIQISNYDDHKLKQIDEIHIQPGDWVVIGAKTLHDVIGIEGYRVAVHIGIDSNFDLENWEYTDEEGMMKQYSLTEG